MKGKYPSLLNAICTNESKFDIELAGNYLDNGFKTHPIRNLSLKVADVAQLHTLAMPTNRL